MHNASMDLWVEGDWGKETMCWHGELAFDLDLYMSDSIYASIVDTHIKRSMEFLRIEIEQIGLRYSHARPL